MITFDPFHYNYQCNYPVTTCMLKLIIELYNRKLSMFYGATVTLIIHVMVSTLQWPHICISAMGGLGSPTGKGSG